MAIRRPPDTPPDLKPEVVSILLAGWAAPQPPEPGPHGFGGGFMDLIEPKGAGIVRLWQQHEPWLRAKAEQWGWRPEWDVDGRPVFYAEYVAHNGREW